MHQSIQCVPMDVLSAYDRLNLGHGVVLFFHLQNLGQLAPHVGAAGEGLNTRRRRSTITCRTQEKPDQLIIQGYILIVDEGFKLPHT